MDISEGNYKLYDKSSLIILEKIIALKHIGFSLEEIKTNLENDEGYVIMGMKYFLLNIASLDF